MFFLWTREPKPVTAGPWFAWFATSLVLWRCRRLIVKAVVGVASPLRYICRRRSQVAAAAAAVRSNSHHRQLTQHQYRRRLRMTASEPVGAGDHRRVVCLQPKYHESKAAHRKPPQALRRQGRRLKRLHNAGDGLHLVPGVVNRKLPVSKSCIQLRNHIYYRVTRSGRIYGTYLTKPPPVGTVPGR